jgi:putative peptidoglycan lipid II flippase
MKRIFSLFNKENSVRGASVILIITLALSNLLGFLRDHFLTQNIATAHLDVYNASFRIPDLILNLLIIGAIFSAFIPIFSDFLAKDQEKDGFEVANTLINLSFLVIIVAATIFYFLIPTILPHIMKFDPERMSEAITYSRILIFTPIFFSISYILGGMLNCYKRFFFYSLAPLIYNLSIIFGAAFLAPTYGLKAVVYTVVAGSFLHLLIQIPVIIKLGFRYRPIINLKNEAIPKIIKLMIPRTISNGANQLMLFFFTAIASALAVGSISAFSYATNIHTVPVVVLGSSFATAVYPILSLKYSQKKSEEFSLYLNKTIRTIGYLLIPSTIIFILLRAQIVRLILGSGKFDWNDTKVTAMVLGFLSLSILAQGLVPVLSRAYFAMKDTKTPMYISIFTFAISVIIAYPLSASMGVAGLALAYSIGCYINLILLFYYLNITYRGVLDGKLVGSYLKTTFISILMGASVWGTMHFMANLVDMTRFFGVLTQTIISSAVGLSVFILLGFIFKQEEMKWAFKRKINEPEPEKFEEQRGY